MKRGTGIFNYREKCQDCKKLSLVDINGFCKDCYIEDLDKEMKGDLIKNEIYKN